MGKLVVIGDIHGRAVWRKIVDDNPDADKFIFLGDYFDSYEKKYYPSRQVFNFKQILQLQEELGKDKVILLLGNHDYHYFNNSEKYSGYSQTTYFDANPLLKENYRNGNIKIFHVEDNILFSHAGFSEYWLKNVSFPNTLEGINDNELFDFRTLEWNMDCGINEYGDTKSNSPIWIRSNSLRDYKLDGYIQVVGHTWFHENAIDELKSIGEHEGIYLVDCLPHHYLIIENNEFKYVEINYETQNESI